MSSNTPNERFVRKSETVAVVRDYIISLTEHRPSDVEEAVALTALEQLRRERDDLEQRLHAYKRGERG